MTDTSTPGPVVAIAGAALTGSEAAALAAEMGATVLVLEQRDEPHGAMFSRIPVWHFDERDAQIAVINDNLSRPGVWFVPNTALGSDVSLEALTAMGVQVVFAALGARGVPAPSPTGAAPLSSGEVDDDTFLRWFNHRGRRGYIGPVVEPPEGAVVLGHGVTAIDCARSLSFMRAVTVLAAHGKQTGSIPLHRRGVLGTVVQHGLSLDTIGLGVTRLYLGVNDALLPSWVDDATRGAVLARLAEDRVEVVHGEPPADAPMVIRVGTPAVSSPPLGPGLIDLTPSLPDLLMLEREWPGGAALQRRLLRVRTGVEPLVPLEDMDDDTLSEAAYALVEELRLAVRAAIAPHVERAIAGVHASVEARARVEAWARGRRLEVGAED